MANIKPVTTKSPRDRCWPVWTHSNWGSWSPSVGACIVNPQCFHFRNRRQAWTM